REYGLPPKILTADAEAALQAYTWPGNVRELANLMERVAVLSDAELVTAAAMRLPRAPLSAGATRVGESVNEQVASLERARIEEALRADGWNISRAAARLGLPRNTLRYRMERHGLMESGEGAPRRRSDSPAVRPGEEEAPQKRAAPPSPVRWQRTRVTLLHAQVLNADAMAAEHERAGVIENIARKVSTFGGRIIEVGPECVKAAFGLDLIEDAARHAAHAAFAVQG